MTPEVLIAFFAILAPLALWCFLASWRRASHDLDAIIARPRPSQALVSTPVSERRELRHLKAV